MARAPSPLYRNPSAWGLHIDLPNMPLMVLTRPWRWQRRSSLEPLQSEFPSQETITSFPEARDEADWRCPVLPMLSAYRVPSTLPAPLSVQDSSGTRAANACGRRRAWRSLLMFATINDLPFVVVCPPWPTALRCYRNISPKLHAPSRVMCSSVFRPSQWSLSTISVACPPRGPWIYRRLPSVVQ